mgnify:CR=1 FL=1|jgi:Skp family chaperone for outer membrane proteins
MPRSTTTLACSTLAVLAALAVLLTGALVSEAQVASAPSTRRPPIIAIVDVTRLMEGLTEFNDRNREFTAKGEGYQRALQELAEKIRQGQNDLQNTIDPKDVKRRLDKIREVEEDRVLLEARQEGYKRLVELEQGDFINSLYTKVLAAVDALAQREGIDLVLADDRDVRTRPNAPIAENRRRIEARSVLFATQALDLTDRLITIMNNDYAAGRQSP